MSSTTFYTADAMTLAGLNTTDHGTAVVSNADGSFVWTSVAAQGSKTAKRTGTGSVTLGLFEHSSVYYENHFMSL